MDFYLPNTKTNSIGSMEDTKKKKLLMTVKTPKMGNY